MAAFGNKKSIPYLIRLVDDPFVVKESPSRSIRGYLRPNRRVWHVAMEALEKLTGVTPQGTSVVARRTFWREWFAKGKADDR